MKDPAVPLNFAIFLHNRKQSEEAKKMLQLFELRVQKLRTTPGLDADPDVLQAASNLAEKMEFNLGISAPKPTTSKRRESIPESAKSSRKSALKSARAAGKAQLKADGNAANEDDIRVTERQQSNLKSNQSDNVEE